MIKIVISPIGSKVNIGNMSIRARRRGCKLQAILRLNLRKFLCNKKLTDLKVRKKKKKKSGLSASLLRKAFLG